MDGKYWRYLQHIPKIQFTLITTLYWHHRSVACELIPLSINKSLLTFSTLENEYNLELSPDPILTKKGRIITMASNLESNNVATETELATKTDLEAIIAIPDATAPVNKTVYLIRHAESDENRRLHSFGRILKGCSSLTPPNKSDVVASMELLNIQAQIDSDVSEIGRRQINQLGARLEKDNFVKEKGIQLVAHSPLKRARQTSEGMLRCVTPRPNVTTEEDSTAAGAKASSVSKVIELDILKERTPLEWLPTYQDGYKQRIASFEQWLAKQPESVIAIVGHSQYFKSMLGLDYKFGNCDVWELQFDCTGSARAILTGDTGESERKLTDRFKDRLKLRNNIDVDHKVEDPSPSLESQIENDCANGSTEGVIKLPHGWQKLIKLYGYDENM